jgi:hypothetical protein
MMRDATTTRASHRPRRPDQGVPVLEGGHGLLELWPPGPRPRGSAIDVGVVAPHTGREKVLDLPIGVLPGVETRASDELAHDHSECLATNVECTILAAEFRYIVVRLFPGGTSPEIRADVIASRTQS